MEINTKSTKKAMFLIVFAIFVWWLFENFKFVGKGLNIFLEILAPFIIGLAIAFILNKPMSFIEGKLFSKKGLFKGIRSKYKRPISLLITLILFFLVIAIVLILVIPNIIEAGGHLAEIVPGYLDNLQEYVKDISIKYPQIGNLILNINFEDVGKSILEFLKGGISNWIGPTFTVLTSLIGGFVSTVIGFVFSIYFLLQKEELILNIKKLLFSALPLNVAERTIYIAKITKEAFSEFITGQSLDALALGTLFFVSMLIFRFPYALMISVIITITAFIPIVGTFIGLIVGAFLIFVENPTMAIYFVILFLVLQQIEGNFIYPRVVGKAAGLPPVWIIAAVTLGGSLLGIVGIILFVPLFSVIQKLLIEYTDRKLKEKKLEKIK